MMEFITILIVLGLLQVWGSGGPMQQDNWFIKLIGWVKGIFKDAKLRLLVVVSIPVALVFMLESMFDSWLFGLLSLVLNVGVLLFSLGRGDYSENIQRYLSAWNHGNFESAYERALSIGDFKESDHITDHQTLHEKVREALLYEGYERWFAVIFWYLLLGPMGAMGYRLSYLCGRSAHLNNQDRQLALRFVHYLDWVPVRLLALSFALTGNFVSGFSHCWASCFDNRPASELVSCCALAAIGSDSDSLTEPVERKPFIDFGKRQIVALQSLLSRSVVCWLILIALTTLIS